MAILTSNWDEGSASSFLSKMQKHWHRSECAEAQAGLFLCYSIQLKQFLVQRGSNNNGMVTLKSNGTL